MITSDFLAAPPGPFHDYERVVNDEMLCIVSLLYSFVFTPIYPYLQFPRDFSPQIKMRRGFERGGEGYTMIITLYHCGARSHFSYSKPASDRLENKSFVLNPNTLKRVQALQVVVVIMRRYEPRKRC